MKRILLLTALILSALHPDAQDTGKHVISIEKIIIKTDESTEKMSQGYNHCLSVFIPDARQKDVERDFARYMKQFDTKADQTKGEFFFHNALCRNLNLWCAFLR